MIAENFSWGIIDEVLDVCNHIIGEVTWVIVFGQEPSYDAVSMLYGTFLP